MLCAAEEAEEIRQALLARNIWAPLLSENWIAGEIFASVEGDALYLLCLAHCSLCSSFCGFDFAKAWIALGVCFRLCSSAY